MSSSRTSPMKDAFKKLQVQSPYRLPKDGPGFIPPVDSPRKEVATISGAENQGTPLPKVEITSAWTDVRSTQPEVSSTTGEFDQRSEQPMVTPTKGSLNQRSIEPEAMSTIGKNDQRSPAPPVEATIGVSDQRVQLPEVFSTSGPHVPPVENTIAAKLTPNPLDAFLPPGRTDVTWREKGPGRLHIPHQLFEFAQKATSSRNELLIFNCLIRFSLGFHRTQCEAGYAGGNGGPGVAGGDSGNILVEITDSQNIQVTPVVIPGAGGQGGPGGPGGYGGNSGPPGNRDPLGICKGFGRWGFPGALGPTGPQGPAGQVGANGASCLRLGANSSGDCSKF